MAPLKQLSEQEAIALTRGPYATTVERAISASIAPFLWRERHENGAFKIRNGTVFFFESDGQTFMVTADHVFTAYLEARSRFGNFARCQIGNFRLDPENRLVARSAALDVATFLISPEKIGRTAYEERFPMSFDPMPPRSGKGVFFAGFPGLARRLGEREVEHGIFTALTVADNVTDKEISGHFDRERQVDKPGRPTAPEGYDIGGVSGAPLVTMVDSANLCYWRLGGVMTGFSTAYEIFYATRADFILPDGTLKDDGL